MNLTFYLNIKKSNNQVNQLYSSFNSLTFDMASVMEMLSAIKDKQSEVIDKLMKDYSYTQELMQTFFDYAIHNNCTAECILWFWNDKTVLNVHPNSFDLFDACVKKGIKLNVRARDVYGHSDRYSTLFGSYNFKVGFDSATRARYIFDLKGNGDFEKYYCINIINDMPDTRVKANTATTVMSVETKPSLTTLDTKTKETKSDSVHVINQEKNNNKTSSLTNSTETVDTLGISIGYAIVSVVNKMMDDVIERIVRREFKKITMDTTNKDFDDFCNDELKTHISEWIKTGIHQKVWNITRDELMHNTDDKCPLKQWSKMASGLEHDIQEYIKTNFYKKN